MKSLRVMRAAADRVDAQFVIATHAPLLMAYPGATIPHLTPQGITERAFRQTDHFIVMREFYRDPDAFMAMLFNG